MDRDIPQGDRRHPTARALADPTRVAILELLEASHGPLDVVAITDVVGVHHTSVRSHLATLRDAGLVAETTAAPTGRGRPKRLYRAVAGRPVAGDAYRELAAVLARAARDGVTPRAAGSATGREAARTGDDDPARTDGVDAIEHAARRSGFDPRRSGTQRRPELVLQHCPFSDVAVDDPETICSLHLGLAEGIAEARGDVEVLGLSVRDPRRAGCRLRLHRNEAAPGAGTSAGAS